MYTCSTKRARVSVVNETTEDDEKDDDAKVTCDGDRVYFYSDVSRKTVLQLLSCLTKASDYALRHCQNVSQCTVFLYIHSEGGDAYAGLSAFDHIRNNKVCVTAVVDGYCASAATFLLLGAEYRVAFKHSTMLVHQLSTTFWGKFCDLVDEVQNSSSLMETLKTIYAENTHLKKKKIEHLLSKERNMNAYECLELGFVNEIW